MKVLGTPFAKLGRNHFGRQRSAAGSVRVLVRRDHLPLGASMVDEADGVGGFTPILGSKRLQMRDMDRQAGIAADFQSLGDGFE